MRIILALLLSIVTSASWAVSGVNPFGVNVRSSGPTTIFLTFQNLNNGQTPAEAFWCGELQPAVANANPTLQLPFPVQNANPCLPGTIFGRLPLQLDQSRQSTSGALRNLTDIMTIPASVSRRAYQDAIAGKNSSFFYVRRFTGGGVGDQFVVVTCRMGGGGARTPLALLDVRVGFESSRGQETVLGVMRDTELPSFSAKIFYNGTGTLRGRWELVQPGDVEPTAEDLLTEATLPVERRGLQRRYRLLDRFSIFLPPTGEVVVPGPDPEKLPTAMDGPYKVLLRIEATNDKEGTSNTGGGRSVFTGGVAGFPMPVLRYYVGDAQSLAGLGQANAARLSLFLPQADASVPPDQSLSFQWVDHPDGALYRLQVQNADEDVLSAIVKPGAANYMAPPWFLQEQAGATLRWRVIALNASGTEVAQSDWRALRLAE
ncbi:MAG: hypothetical protein R3E68_10370 [Burkholderiaceae bacterium]